MTILHKYFFWHNIAADINKYVKLEVSNSAKNKVT